MPPKRNNRGFGGEDPPPSSSRKPSKSRKAPSGQQPPGVFGGEDEGALLPNGGGGRARGEGDEGDEVNGVRGRASGGRGGRGGGRSGLVRDRGRIPQGDPADPPNGAIGNGVGGRCGAASDRGGRGGGRVGRSHGRTLPAAPPTGAVGNALGGRGSARGQTTGLGGGQVGRLQARCSIPLTQDADGGAEGSVGAAVGPDHTEPDPNKKTKKKAAVQKDPRDPIPVNQAASDGAEESVGAAVGPDPTKKTKKKEASPKKTGKKGSKRNQGYLPMTEYPIDPPADQFSQLKKELDNCYSYELSVKAVKECYNLGKKPQESVKDLHVFKLPSTLSPDDLRTFYQESVEYYLSNYPFWVPGKLRDGTFTCIPLTPEKEPSIKLRRHHIVALTRESDGAAGQILVEDYSGYCVACRMVYPWEMEEDVPWYNYGDEPLDSDKFKWHRTKYGPGYSRLHQVFVDEGTGERILSHIASFRGDDDINMQEVTADGEFCQDTKFVLIGEGRRFGDIQEWLLNNQGLLPVNYELAVRNWLSQSKCVYIIFLYLLQLGLVEFPGDLMDELNSETLVAAVDMWTTRQKILQSTGIIFYEVPEAAFENIVVEDDVQAGNVGHVQDVIIPDLLALSGGRLLLLRHDPRSWDKIMMRQLGYRGQLMNDIV